MEEINKSFKLQNQKQIQEMMKLKEKNETLKTKNEELNNKMFNKERRSNSEICRLSEELISAQCENKKIRDLVQDLKDQIVETETNKRYESLIYDLKDKYNKKLGETKIEMKQFKKLYKELMEEFNQYKKKLLFQQEITIEKDQDIENYKFENQHLKTQIVSFNKKLKEKENFKFKEKEWQKIKEKLTNDIIEYKKIIKKLRQNINRKENIMDQLKNDKEKIMNKFEKISFFDSNQYKKLNKELESIKNQLHLKENLLIEIKKKYQTVENNVNKLKINNLELQNKNRSISCEISRKDILINELKNKLQDIENENISNKSNLELIETLRQKCKSLKSNENRKTHLLKSNKQRIKTMTKELNNLKQSTSQKQLKLQSKLSKIQNEEQLKIKKYFQIENELNELKNIINTLYNKLSVNNNDLICEINKFQKNYQCDDTLKAAKILDDFSLNELQEIMHFNVFDGNENKHFSNQSLSKSIIWEKYHENKNVIIKLFENIINERIRLEMMVKKFEKYEKNVNQFQNDQFEKIKIKHKKHLNEYQSMLNKFGKHK